MISNMPRQWVFVSIPKCYTHTMYKLLCEPCFGGRRWQGYHTYTLPPNFKRKGLFLFANTRNPYDRIVSIWRAHSRVKFAEKFGPGAPDNFNDWALWAMDKADLSIYIIPQVERLRPIGLVNFKRLKVENRVGELLTLPFLSAAAVQRLTTRPLPHLLPSDKVYPPILKIEKEDIRPDVIQALNKYYHHDFGELGYEMILPEEK